MKRRFRLHRNRVKRGVKFSQPPRRSDECSRSSESCDKVRNSSIRLTPDLMPGSRMMGHPVGIVVVLVGIEIPIGMFFCELARDFLRPVGGLKGVGFDDLCPKVSQDLLPSLPRIPW